MSSPLKYRVGSRETSALKSNLRLDLLDYGCKCFRIMEGNVRQCLTVELNVMLLELIHEDGIAHTVFTDAGVDALNPQLAELTAAYPSMCIRVCASPFGKSCSGADGAFSASEETLSPGKYFLTSSLARWVVGCAWHILTPFQLRVLVALTNHPGDAWDIHFSNQAGLGEFALAVAWLLGQHMTLEAFITLDLAGACATEALGGGAISSHLRHASIPGSGK